MLSKSSKKSISLGKSRIGIEWYVGYKNYTIYVKFVWLITMNETYE
jgi:hypothetical protein